MITEEKRERDRKGRKRVSRQNKDTSDTNHDMSYHMM